ncbi:NmrA family NAD(P)-binding protein [Phytomonospora sp. NPDC050363]|uniref:NmrA family NAD(P)-binding protein n=1 Tax=Phytomonospora sp. NPDC050363 TaxID=3155642 RepID=UPI0034067D06
MTYLVLGATGKTGRHVVSSLTARGAEARPASRATGFDLTDPATWDAALEGVTGAYIVETTEHPTLPGEFAARAVAAGVRRLVFLSARLTHPTQLPGIEGREKGVVDSGAEWTILRPAWFTQNVTELGMFSEPLAADGVLSLPTGQGREPFIDTRDIADVVAAVLLEDGHQGKLYELTGPRALTFTELIDGYAEATGKDVRYQAISEEDYVAGLLKEGMSDEEAAFMATMLAELRESRGAELTTTVRDVLGREPRDVTEWLGELRSAR